MIIMWAMYPSFSSVWFHPCVLTKVCFHQWFESYTQWPPILAVFCCSTTQIFPHPDKNGILVICFDNFSPSFQFSLFGKSCNKWPLIYKCISTPIPPPPILCWMTRFFQVVYSEWLPFFQDTYWMITLFLRCFKPSFSLGFINIMDFVFYTA